MKKKIDFRKIGPSIVTALIIIFLDQISKYLIVQFIPLYSKVIVIPGLIDLVHIKNRGIAFGIFNNPSMHQSWILSIITIIAIGVIFYLIITEGHRDSTVHIPLGLILGGAIGNLIDRILFGSVTDFIDIYIGKYHWPAFNIADMAISIGGLLFIILMIKGKRYAPNSN